MIKDYKRKILMLGNALSFTMEIIFLCIVYWFWETMKTEIKDIQFSEGLINTLFMLYAYFRLEGLIKKVRKTADEGKYVLKGVYKIYICFLLVTICCAYNFAEIKSLCVSFDLKKILVLGDVSIYWILSCAYKGIQIIQTSIEVVLVKDVIFEINGWNINRTVAEYWDELLKNEKVYILHEDQHKRLPRLWVIRGDACGDIVDHSNDLLIHHSRKEYISLTDEQAKEILRRRKINDNDECIYEGESALIFIPWKVKHFYAVSLIMIDMECYKEDAVVKLIQENRERIQLLPSDVKSCERKYIKKVVAYKEKIEKAIMKVVE